MNLKRSILCAVLLSGILSAAETFSFVRPARVSESFRCSLLVKQSSQYSFFVPGNDRPVVKLSSVQADFYGYLTVLQVNSAGNPDRIRIRADRISGAVNGRAVKADFPPAAVIEGDLTGGKAQFSSGGKTLAPDLQLLFAHLFPPASNASLADLTGRSHVLPKTGEGWKPDLTAFIKMLERRRIQLPPASFRSGVTYHGPERVGKLQCRKFTILIETAKLTDYDCRFKFTFSLAPSGPPVQSVREVTEVIRQVIRSEQPFAAGTRIELLNQDHTECTLLPVASVPPPKKAEKPRGAWESLLH
ncbi:MAG: hypothetical protein IKO93_16715 [Lentisphaeria bacterium]|nr:hypothetical protein [Lentisphaeria bacterium]